MADLRVVCDTNVYIAAALWGGQAEAIIQLAAAGAIPLLTSPAILAELMGYFPERQPNGAWIARPHRLLPGTPTRTSLAAVRCPGARRLAQ